MKLLKNKGYWLFILIGFLIGMAFVTGGTKAVVETSSSSFCISCHDSPTFAPAFASQEHGKLECKDCHSEGVIKDKTQGIGHFISTMKDKEAPNKYAHYSAKFDSNKCISCHNLDSDLKTDYVKNRHASYIRKEMDCTRCHDQKFVHGFEE